MTQWIHTYDPFRIRPLGKWSDVYRWLCICVIWPNQEIVVSTGS